MVRQTILPFKLERTEERITARSGLTLYAEFLHALRIEALVDQYLPQPRSGRGLQASRYVTPLSLTIYSTVGARPWRMSGRSAATRH